jgi:hypothetical protein
LLRGPRVDADEQKGNPNWIKISGNVTSVVATACSFKIRMYEAAT